MMTSPIWRDPELTHCRLQLLPNQQIQSRGGEMGPDSRLCVESILFAYFLCALSHRPQISSAASVNDEWRSMLSAAFADLKELA